MEERNIIGLVMGGLISIGLVFWVMLGLILWAVSPIVAVVFWFGPIVGYLWTKPAWVNKFWKQKEYRE